MEGDSLAWAHGGFLLTGQSPARAQVRHTHLCLVSVGNPFLRAGPGSTETLDAPRLSLSKDSADLRAPRASQQLVTWVSHPLPESGSSSTQGYVAGSDYGERSERVCPYTCERACVCVGTVFISQNPAGAGELLVRHRL